MGNVITGHCLCGAVQCQANVAPIATVNCHCTDCRRVTGSVYGTVLYFERSDVTITGALGSFEHKSDRGSALTKQFCAVCGSQVFVMNGAYPTWIGIRAGCIDQTSNIQPQRNVFVESKVETTPMDPSLPAIRRMP